MVIHASIPISTEFFLQTKRTKYKQITICWGAWFVVVHLCAAKILLIIFLFVVERTFDLEIKKKRHNKSKKKTDF